MVTEEATAVVTEVVAVEQAELNEDGVTAAVAVELKVLSLGFDAAVGIYFSSQMI